MPEELRSHNCLLLRYPRSQEYFWVLDTAHGPLKLEVAGSYDSDDGDVLTAWALDGRGVINKPRFDVADHVADGSMVELLPQTPPSPSLFGCLYPHRRLQDPKIRLFIDFILERCRDRLLSLDEQADDAESVHQGSQMTTKRAPIHAGYRYEPASSIRTEAQRTDRMMRSVARSDPECSFAL